MTPPVRDLFAGWRVLDTHMQALTPTIKKTNPQPLEAANLPDALLTLKTAAAISGLSEPTLYRKARAGELKMIRIGTRCTRIRSADLRAFMASLG